MNTFPCNEMINTELMKVIENFTRLNKELESFSSIINKIKINNYIENTSNLNRINETISTNSNNSKISNITESVAEKSTSTNQSTFDYAMDITAKLSNIASLFSSLGAIYVASKAYNLQNKTLGEQNTESGKHLAKLDGIATTLTSINQKLLKFSHMSGIGTGAPEFASPTPPASKPSMLSMASKVLKNKYVIGGAAAAAGYGLYASLGHSATGPLGQGSGNASTGGDTTSALSAIEKMQQLSEKLKLNVFNSIPECVKSMAEKTGVFMKGIGLDMQTAAAGMLAMDMLKPFTALSGGFGMAGKAFNVLKLAMLSCPAIAIVSGIAASAYLIYENWDKISAFFKRIWSQVGQAFESFKQSMSAFWRVVSASMANGWQSITEPFTNCLNWLNGLGQSFMKSGMAIVNSLWEGISSKVGWLFDKFRGALGKLMDFFPRSPAKEGPLREIGKIKIMENIAETIKPSPLLEAMHKTSGVLMTAMPKTLNFGFFSGQPEIKPVSRLGVIERQNQANTNSSPTSIDKIVLVENYNPQVTINGALTPDGASLLLDVLRQHAYELTSIIQKELKLQQRWEIGYS